jgi:ubiquinone/menaquinone biosynthesis C-methylase UbiE
MGTIDEGKMAYPIGETDAQSRRLITQAQLYNPSTRAFFQAAGIGRGMKVLELGSGVGDVSLVLADLVGPSGRVVGVEVENAAVETARARMAAIGWHNIEFVSGAIESVELDRDFDAVAGRFILMWLHDPLTVLERVVTLLRPGGVVAFQDNDFSFAISASSPLPLFDSVIDWLNATQGPNGPDYHMGLKMQKLYQRVGLPAPQLTCDVPLGTGEYWTGYQYLAETLEMLEAPMRHRGISMPAEFDPSTLAERIQKEAADHQAAIILPAIFGAWSRTPAAQG